MTNYNYNYNYTLCCIDGCYKEAIECTFIPNKSDPVISELCEEHAKKLGYCPKCGNFGLENCCKDDITVQ